MNFNAPLLRTVRLLLFPVSLLYAAVIWVRNRLYDSGIWQSVSFNLPVICVGNLAVGGTGKSTMIEYLLGRFAGQWQVAVLSRGYKRKTRGYALANESSTALEIGDEPMLFHSKFPHVSVAVGEERVVAMAQLLHDRPGTQLVLLDDAFQHRAIKAGLNILLTEYSNLFTRDWYLPTGDLRDEKKGFRRAQIIVVTKAPLGLEPEEMKRIREEMQLSKEQELFFSHLNYGKPYHILNKKTINIGHQSQVLLVTGIANPAPLKKYLDQAIDNYEEILYSDHHIFSIDDWRDIQQRFGQMKALQPVLLTTEKDAVRLLKFGKELESLPVYVLPVEMGFPPEQEKRFSGLISTFIGGYRAHPGTTITADE